MTPRTSPERSDPRRGRTGRADVVRERSQLPIHPARVVERLWGDNKSAVMARSYAAYAGIRDLLSRGVGDPAELRARLRDALRGPEREISNALSHAYGHLKDYAPDDVRAAIRAAIDSDPDRARELIFRQALLHGEEVLQRSRLFYASSWFDRIWITAGGTWYLVTCEEGGSVVCQNEDAVRTLVRQKGDGAADALERVVDLSSRGSGARPSREDRWLSESGELAPLLLVTHVGRYAYANLLPAVTMLRSLSFN